MTPALGPYLVACATLVAAGLAKIHRPGNTARAVVAWRPGTPLGPLGMAVRAGAIAELLLGVAAACFPRPALAGAVALSYAGFAAFAALARRRGGSLATCGCFGTPDTAATWLHVVLDAGLSASAVCVAVSDRSGRLAFLPGARPLDGAALLLAALVGTALVLLAMTSLGRLAAVRSAPEGAGAGHLP